MSLELDSTPAPNGVSRAKRSWPNTIAAAAQTGFNRRKLERLAEAGALFREKDSTGTTRWDPDLLAIAAQVGDDDDDDGADAKPQTTTAGEAVALVKQAHTHLEATLRLVLEPAQALNRQLREENEALRSHIRKLEEQHHTLLSAREKLISEVHLRELATTEAQAREARKDRALTAATDALPKLLGAVNPKATAVVSLMQSLSEEQRGMLLHTDLLTADQKALVRQVIETPAVIEDEKKDEA